VEEPVAAVYRWKVALRNTAYIIVALVIFLFALDVMISSLERIGRPAAEAIVSATSNPFTGLFIGLLVTAIMQSSSATTTMAIALVASGSMTLEGAVPIIMGANVGTTITSAIVSLGFIARKKEFRRAVAGGTYHSFFNILTVLVLFPLEYYYGFLSKSSQYIADVLFKSPAVTTKTEFSFLGSGFNPLIHLIGRIVPNGILLAVLSVVLLFGSILFFRKMLTDLLGFGSQERFRHFFFRSPLKSFAWGLVTTAAIRSSTVTTSLVVPLVAKKAVKRKAAIPFVLGANVGTTVTAFVASMFNANAAISIAIAHFLFNAIGVLIFSFVPYIKDIPADLARGLGKLVFRSRLAGFLYLLLTFFVVPFSLIYFNRNTVVIRELAYVRHAIIRQTEPSFQVVEKMHEAGSWVGISPPSDANGVISVYRKGNRLLIGNELFEFNAPGSCRRGADPTGNYTMCVREIKPGLMVLQKLSIDSVYVFEKQTEGNVVHSGSVWYYIGKPQNLLVRKEKRDNAGRIIESDELVGVVRR
jgi:sodium-dependent phosphate cotransporter